jgi:transcription elongation factor Elf1
MSQVNVAIDKDGKPVVNVTDAVAKSLKSQFFCPNCSKTMEVKLNRKEKLGEVSCGSCGLKHEIQMKGGFEEPVDIYHEMMDKHYRNMGIGVRKKI